MHSSCMHLPNLRQCDNTKFKEQHCPTCAGARRRLSRVVRADGTAPRPVRASPAGAAASSTHHA
eukprot:11202047-Lingulodinium_polyedra.AAC.1